MILANGKIFGNEKSGELLAAIRNDIISSLSDKKIDRTKLISACDRLGKRIADGEFSEKAAQLTGGTVSAGQILSAAQMLSADSLNARLSAELGNDIHRARPLGVLFHIAAGNADGLPAYSVVEGLLTGNVNILKLPQADSGLSLSILHELMKEEPSLAPFVYVFDTPSSDIEGMKRLAALSDGIVVWGGDEAVRAVRQLAAPHQRLIEWGHKLSFCYISEMGMENTAELTQLAEHIILTDQLLCSSCQTIYLDISDNSKAEKFCEGFLKILESAAQKHNHSANGFGAGAALELYCERLEALAYPENVEHKLFCGKGVSVTLGGKPYPELSKMFGNPLVKLLPRSEMVSHFFGDRGHMQTAGLICAENEREQLSDLLIRAGAVKVRCPAQMSEMHTGEPHDGEFALRRYVKILE